MVINLGKFEIKHGEDDDRLHVTVDGIYLIINKTNEGLILDVVDDEEGDMLWEACLDNEILYPPE